jgi:hypothetical protein
MKLKMGWLGPAVVSAFTLAVACGGSSDNNGESPGSGGSASAGKAGSSTSGSSSGGSSSGAGGSSAGKPNGGNTSTAGNGGTRNSAGTNSTGGIDIGFGGAGFDPSDFACDPAPEAGSECEAGATPCLDGTKICYCQTGEWACTDVGGLGGASAGGGTGPLGDIECPATKPTSGAACGDSVGFCPYGGGFMGCACYQGSWACL